MRYLGRTVLVSLLGVGLYGCVDNSHPLPYAIAPEVGYDTYRREVDYPKPLPNGPYHDPRAEAPVAPPVGDATAATDAVAPTDAVAAPAAFLTQYDRVGRPRFIVYVNRSLDGQLLPGRQPGTGQPVAVIAGEFLKDEQAGVDLTAFEAELSNAMSAGNKVNVIAPATVQSKLNESQIAELQSGRESVLAALDESVQGHVLIQAQARPVRKTDGGVELRIFAEAINVRGGELLAKASAGVVAPMDGAASAQAARRLAGELMAGTAQTWAQPLPQPQKDVTTPTPATATPKKNTDTNESTDRMDMPVSTEGPVTGLRRGLPAPLPPPPPPSDND